MKQKVKFVLEWERRWEEAKGDYVNVAELCRMFGVSRQTGYYWIRRYRDAGHKLDALEERSRRPKTSPTAAPEEIQDLIVAARKHRPRWGPRKLHAWLRDRYPDRPWPSPSTIGAILKRHGLTTRRKRRRSRGPVPGVVAPFAACEKPNDVWCIDFKGKFRTQDGQWCHVLTLLDAYSRFLLRCEATLDPDGRVVEHVMDSAFREFGVPTVLRSDNGPPFASNAVAGLTRVSVWWLKLGIRLERIAPGKPQQNGRQERVHLTLEDEEVVSPPRADLRAQQRTLDVWRKEYNEERPHEALGLKPPASVYVPSRRHYPRPSVSRESAPWNRVCKVDKGGFIGWGRRKVFVSSALWGEQLELCADDYRWLVCFGELELGWIDETRLDKGLVQSRRRRLRKGEIASLSLT